MSVKVNYYGDTINTVAPAPNWYFCNHVISKRFEVLFNQIEEIIIAAHNVGARFNFDGGPRLAPHIKGRCTGN